MKHVRFTYFATYFVVFCLLLVGTSLAQTNIVLPAACATCPSTAPTNPTGFGSLSGKTCFDVALSNDNTNSCGPLSSRIGQQANFTQAATNTQTYTFTPSGTVSNVRFVYVNTNGTAITALTGGSPGNNINSAVTATATYASTLNTPATGLTTSNAITSDIYVVYNNSAENSGLDLQIKLTASIRDCACCGAFVAAGVWKEFLCYNLGANTSIDPHVPAVGIHGALIQWGKRGPNTTGDSRVDWQTAANNGPLGFSAAPKPGNDNTVTISGWSTTPAADYAWRTTSSAKTANDPCPTGYRVPISAEWSGVVLNNTISRSGTWGSVNTNYSSAIHFGPNASTKLLTLPAAGIRSIAANNGAFGSRGSNGYYWSSNEGANSGPALLLAFISTDQYPLFTSDRLFGMSIRCIQDNYTYTVSPVAPAASVGALNCSGATTTGTLVANMAASGVSTSVPYTGGNYGTYAAQNISSTGVTGLTASLAPGSLYGGSSSVTYTISGTPSGSGTANFAISLGGQSCTLGLSVVVATTNNPIGTGSLSGKTCFDVAISSGNATSCGSLASRASQKSDFTQAATNTQTYTFTPSGIVSNVRFVYVNTNGTAITALSGGNTGNNISSPVTATVTYANTLNTPATGLTNSNAITSEIYVVYNNSANNTGTDVQIKLSVSIKDCSCCGAFVAAGVYKEFLCHNLGADISLDPHVPVVGIHGAYIQWGKRGPNTTGDSRIDWQTAANDGPSGFVAAPTATNANFGAITGWAVASAGTSGAWQSTKTISDPCPSGYRVPTHGEWTGVNANNPVTRIGTFNGSNTEYASAAFYGPNANSNRLTLPAAGYREDTVGAQNYRGNNGFYWSSTESGNYTAYAINFYSNSSINPQYKIPFGYALPVRCIAE